MTEDEELGVLQVLEYLETPAPHLPTAIRASWYKAMS
jgi:hypothetical protein